MAVNLVVHPPGFDRVDDVRHFREGVYLRDCVSITPTDWMDALSWHLVAYDDGTIAGCLRYLAVSASWAWASGLASSSPVVSVALIREGIMLSERLGHKVLALATRRHRATDLLVRLGAEVIEEYNDPLHGRMSLVKFGSYQAGRE